MRNSESQRLMHKDFFDRCRMAIDSGFYLEAILMEYAAIESRMEVLLGVLGMPCNKYLDDKDRKKVAISHRLDCADNFRRQSPIFQNSKLSKKFFRKLKMWTEVRNGYIHGLYKNELKYKQRMADRKFAEEGYQYCKELYAEVNRLKRREAKHPEEIGDIACMSSGCSVRGTPKKLSRMNDLWTKLVLFGAGFVFCRKKAAEFGNRIAKFVGIWYYRMEIIWFGRCRYD